MRKTWVKLAEKLFSPGGINQALNTALPAKNTTAAYKPQAFTQPSSALLPSQNRTFQTVSTTFIPTIHTTYNYNYLYKYLLVK